MPNALYAQPVFAQDWEAILGKPKVVKEAIPDSKKKDYTIAALFGQNVVVHHNTAILQAVAASYKPEYPITDNTLMGVEVEVENITTFPDISEHVWMRKDDGSLRNNGVEYVTPPLEALYMPSALLYLNHQLQTRNVPDWSARTSIHVHMNVQDFTAEQVKSFVLLYLCFESLFYLYAGRNRDKSIFCVPLSHAGYTRMLQNIFKNNLVGFATNIRHWQKYTGLNLRTIKEYGTIEFRHLPGTGDVEAISKWISLILDLKKAAFTYSVEDLFSKIAELNSNSEYQIFASSIFNEHLSFFPPNDIQKVMEKNVSHIKECFLSYKELEFDTEQFKKSAFFNKHKLKELIDEVAYDKMTVEELCTLRKQVETSYRRATSAKERDKFSTIYHTLSDLIDKKGEF